MAFSWIKGTRKGWTAGFALCLAGSLLVGGDGMPGADGPAAGLGGHRYR